MKASPSKQELFEYYDARAPEYEEFYDGGPPVKYPDPAVIPEEIAIIKKLLPGYVSGRCIDIACGTGYWLPVYERNCTKITLIDQSEKALYECSKKISKLGIENKTKIICDDIFEHKYDDGLFDYALCGFLISHLTDEEIDNLLLTIKTLLVPDGRFIIMDKLWNDTIAAIRGNKAGTVTRIIKDGRKFQIYNRFFEKQDLYDLAGKHKINLAIVYWGEVFLLATGNFTAG